MEKKLIKRITLPEPSRLGHDRSEAEVRSPEESPETNLAEIIKTARKNYENKLKNGRFNPTLTEYLKLLEFQRGVAEREEEQRPREIKVTWVEPELDSSEE